MKTGFRAVADTTTHALWLAASVRVLEEIERLPNGATGALVFAEHGMVLVENKRICWAVAHGMQRRLTDLLCEQSATLQRQQAEDLYRKCKREGRPLGETLVSSGLVSLAELQSTLLRHNGEALRTLAQFSNLREVKFSSLSARGYDARLSFTTSELLAALSARRYRTEAADAKATLVEFARADARSFAFVRDPQIADGVPIAVDKGCSLRVADLRVLTAWALRTLDVASFVDPGAQVLCGQWCAKTSIVVWKNADVYYVSLCESRPASTLLLSQLEQQLSPPKERAVSAAVPKVSS
jgi:hypothetical protein